MTKSILIKEVLSDFAPLFKNKLSQIENINEITIIEKNYNRVDLYITFEKIEKEKIDQIFVEEYIRWLNNK